MERGLSGHGTQRPQNGCVRPRRPKPNGEVTYPRCSGRPSPPGSYYTRPMNSASRRYAGGRETQLHVCRLSPEVGDSRLPVAQFGKQRPAYDDALCRLGNLLGPPLLMLPTDLALKLRCQLDDHDRLRVGWQAVASGALLALIHRDDTDEY